jgi:hypothetical protein
MRNVLKLVAGLLLFTTACSDSNEKSKSDVTIEMLTAASWGHAEVTHDPDGDLSDQYEDFVIVFTDNGSGEFDGTFVVSSGGYAFEEASGNWRFTDDDSKIVFDSDKEIEFEVSDDHLRLEFTTPAGGKITGVSGHFVFDLQPL